MYEQRENFIIFPFPRTEKDENKKKPYYKLLEKQKMKSSENVLLGNHLLLLTGKVGRRMRMRGY